MKKNLIKIANQIMHLESKVQNGEISEKEYFHQMEQVAFGLSIFDMLEIDNYIQEKILTK